MTRIEGEAPPEEQITKTYRVWDAPTRVLHWMNAILVISVAALGFLFMFRTSLSIDGTPSKFALKTAHSVVGIALIASFGARMLWGFFGNRFARFASFLPRKGTIGAARREASELLSKTGGPKRLGHGPLGRLSATAMFLVMSVSLSTGLLRANTDLHFPPFGGLVARHIAKPGVDPKTLDPSDKASHDPKRLKEVYRISLPAGTLHRVAAWTLLVLLVLHVSGLVLKELRQGGGVLSSMVGGRKAFRADEPVIDDD